MTGSVFLCLFLLDIGRTAHGGKMLGRDLEDGLECTEEGGIVFISAEGCSFGHRHTAADQFGCAEDTAACDVLMEGAAGLGLEGAHQMITTGEKD